MHRKLLSEQATILWNKTFPELGLFHSILNPSPKKLDFLFTQAHGQINCYNTLMHEAQKQNTKLNFPLIGADFGDNYPEATHYVSCYLGTLEDAQNDTTIGNNELIFHYSPAQLLSTKAFIWFNAIDTQFLRPTTLTLTDWPSLVEHYTNPEEKGTLTNNYARNQFDFQFPEISLHSLREVKIHSHIEGSFIKKIIAREEHYHNIVNALEKNQMNIPIEIA